MDLGKKTQFFIEAYNTLHATAEEMNAAYKRFQAEDRVIWEDVERLQTALIENPTEANAIAYAEAMRTTKQWGEQEKTHRTNIRKIDREIRGIEDSLRKAFYEEHVPVLFEERYARRVGDGEDADQCESPG
jgi:hypothetical protein